MKDAGGELKTLRALSPQSDTGGSAVNGVVLDRRGFDSAVMQFSSGAISGSPTSTSIAVKIQQGSASDGSDMADISGATATVTSANTLAEINLDLKDKKRYIRIVETTTFVGGTSPAVLVGAHCVLGEAKELPA